MNLPSWRQNLGRNGGYWNHGRWYDLHVERRMPLVVPMLEEMVAALPPLTAESSVCDLACGTGNLSYMILSAYPQIRLTLLDEDPNLLAMAAEKMADFSRDLTLLESSVRADGEALPGGPFDVMVASLSIHAIVGREIGEAEAQSRYELLFQGIRDTLTPGGHLLIGDHVGTLGLYRQLKALERAGFTDVDCAWRQDDFFVAGGRVPE